MDSSRRHKFSSNEAIRSLWAFMSILLAICHKRKTLFFNIKMLLICIFYIIYLLYALINWYAESLLLRKEFSRNRRLSFLLNYQDHVNRFSLRVSLKFLKPYWHWETKEIVSVKTFDGDRKASTKKNYLPRRAFASPVRAVSQRRVRPRPVWDFLHFRASWLRTPGRTAAVSWPTASGRVNNG